MCRLLVWQMNIWKCGRVFFFKFQPYVNIELPRLRTVFSVCQKHNQDKSQEEQSKKVTKKKKTQRDTYTHHNAITMNIMRKRGWSVEEANVNKTKQRKSSTKLVNETGLNVWNFINNKKTKSASWRVWEMFRIRLLYKCQQNREH